MGGSTTSEVAYRPQVAEADSKRLIEDFVVRLAEVPLETGAGDLLKETLREARSWPRADRLQIEGGLRVVSDHFNQGWQLGLTDDGITLTPPASGGRGGSAEKERIRRQELLKRDEQLAEPATRKFVTSMERPRLHGDGFKSIFSLFRDGRALARELMAVRALGGEERRAALASVVDPYLVFFGSEEACPHTGLRLMEIWRYFRHTWANQYTSVPGRSMPFIVRDRAAPMHPVVGIGALGSSVMQISKRDIRLGWHPQTVLEELRAAPTSKAGAWLWDLVSTGLSELFLEDFLEQGGEWGGLTTAQLQSPSAEDVERLRALGRRSREEHQKNPDAGAHRTAGSSTAEINWEERARTNLFTSKRALALATLLEARLVLRDFLSEEPTPAEVAALAADPRGARTIKLLTKRAKAVRVGTAMADITVCGALPPYGPLLGGKLVCLLAVSPEVVEAYRERYAEADSEITSAMAGRPIQRPADLVFLGTTSLYGRSSQYNRVRIPASRLGGAEDSELRYQHYGSSRAFGTSQYSEATLQCFDALLRSSEAGKRVNNIFGEGTSPKLRKVRDALVALGFKDGLLQHHRQRDLYGVSLISNLKEYLLGTETEPRYLFDRGHPAASEAVASWWRERWVDRRIESEDVLAAVAQHTTTRPVRHGARVALPPEDDGQLGLFDDLDDF